MARELYRYDFDPKVPFANIEETIFLAVAAAEGLYGRSVVRLDTSFSLDPKTRSCVLEAGTEVGRCIARIFTAYVSYEFGEEAFKVERLGSGPAPELKAKRGA